MKPDVSINKIKMSCHLKKAQPKLKSGCAKICNMMYFIF